MVQFVWQECLHGGYFSLIFRTSKRLPLNRPYYLAVYFRRAVTFSISISVRSFLRNVWTIDWDQLRHLIYHASEPFLHAMSILRFRRSIQTFGIERVLAWASIFWISHYFLGSKCWFAPNTSKAWTPIHPSPLCTRSFLQRSCYTVNKIVCHRTQCVWFFRSVTVHVVNIVVERCHGLPELKNLFHNASMIRWYTWQAVLIWLGALV